MSSPPSPALLRLERVGDATVVRFDREIALLGEVVIDVGEQLLQLVDDQGCHQLVLSFANVTHLDSAMIGRLLALSRRLLRAGGRLKLCCVSPPLAEVLDTIKASRLLGVYADEEQALRTF